MTSITSVADGGFGYLPGGPFPFSNGVVALDGYALTRVRLRRPPPLEQGLAFAAHHIAALGLPAACFAACEVRSPAVMSLPEFIAFNAQYAALLQTNGFASEGVFPVARSNMAPQHAPPPTNALFAFTYAAPSGERASGAGADFLISGKPEAIDNPPSIVAAGDVSPTGMAAKARYVIAELQRRVAALGGDWSDITGAQAYTAESLDGVRDELATSGLAAAGLTLFPAYPPIVGFNFEIDVRSISLERAI